MLQLEDEDSVERGFKRLSSLYQLPQSQRCQRCGQTVYQQEKLGPVNDVIFHKQCFRCCVCGTYVTMKNYWTNQTSSEDKEVYCQTHAPRIGGSMLDNKSMGIMSAVTAQDNFRKANSKMTELRFQSDQHSPVLDREAVGRQLSPAVSKSHDYGQPKFTIDENAVHIRGALDAQLLQRRYERKLDKHHFPPHIVKKREQLFETQKRLEEKLRQEEDQMFNEFRQEREKEDKAINKEIDSEWEQQLQQLTEKYQTMMDKKKKKIKDSDQKIMTVQFENEKKDLAATMTSRKQNKKKTMTLRLRQKAQEQTAQLVKKQSQVMLEMLAKEQQVLKAELAREIARVPPFVHDSPETSLADGDKKEMEQVLEILTLPSVGEPPSPNPPKCRKAELFTETSVFSYIDKQVIKVAESEQLTYTDLVRQLTEDLVTDLEKARAIYRWICVKDLNVMEFADNLDADTPLGLLRGIKFGTETYHVLFLRLCSYAGLHCVEIKGHSKSVGYEPGMKMTPDTFQNTWNAVLIGGDWRLIQCNWGARHLVLSKDKEDKKRGNDQIRYQYDDHYFLTDPDEFIQEFWPLDPKWQLLKSPISLGEFEALPFVRSIFFHYKMHFDGHKRAVIDTDDKGGARIAIRVPEEYENDLVFYYQLRFADKEKGKELTYRGALLERYVFQTMLENTLTFNIHVPTAGNYFMEIFANKIDDSGRVEENNASVAPFKLKCACKFKVVCKTLTGTMHPLPNCAAGEWGPKKAQRHFGILPIISTSPDVDMERLGMLTVEDHFELKFRTPHPYQFVAKLRMNGVDSHALDPFVKLSSEGSVLSVSVSLPQPGQYGLDIFARPKGATDKNTLSHACKYLINCSSVSSFIELPKSSSTSSSSSSSSSHSEAKSLKSGPTSTFDELGLKVLSPRDTRTCVTRSNVSILEISCPPHTVLSYQFVREPDEDNRDYVQQSQDGHGITRFKMTFPQKGNYILRLYARKERSENRSAPNVFNYVIRYAPDDAVDVVNGDKRALFLKRSIFSRTDSKDSSSIDST